MLCKNTQQSCNIGQKSLAGLHKLNAGNLRHHNNVLFQNGFIIFIQVVNDGAPCYTPNFFELQIHHKAVA